MAALLVKLHEAVNDYRNSSQDKALATEIGGELLVLTRAVIKKHTFDSERAFKFHLAQPARMLARIVAFWHIRMLRKMSTPGWRAQKIRHFEQRILYPRWRRAPFLIFWNLFQFISIYFRVLFELWDICGVCERKRRPFWKSEKFSQEYGKYKAQNFVFYHAMWHNPWNDVLRQRKRLQYF